MEKHWIDPKLIIGNKATGDFYYSRPELEEEIVSEIKKGNHILIAAPRRFGKTSVAVHIAENCPNGYNCIFENIQGVLSEKDFYKRFYELMLSSLSNNKKLKSKITNFFERIGVEDISLSGKIKFKNKKEIDYLSQINKTLPLLKENDLKLVLFIDELPEVLHNLYTAKKIGEAKGILKNIRRWRQMDKSGSLCLVFTGSVGIHHVVKLIENRVTDINDMIVIDFEPFNKSQAIKYTNYFTKNASVQYDEVLVNHLLDKISYRIPYFINLMLNEININAKKSNVKVINTEDIDNAFDKVIRKSDYFSEWKSRIFDYYSDTDAGFMNEILVFIAHKEYINLKQIYDLAVKHKKTIEYMDLIDDLLRDGYLIELANSEFVFVSPFLKAFWKRNQPIYNG